ncbi:TPA: hypothetical protein ACG7PQ_005133 [Klebsiella pneumoniae]
MSDLVKAVESLSLKSDDIISALQQKINDTIKKNPNEPISINVTVNPTPQGWEFCVGDWCISL